MSNPASRSYTNFDANPGELEVTVLMPCLNEAETLEACIVKALTCLKRLGVQGEVLVADNGSTDGSPEVAQRCGARVVHVTTRGYGAALLAGIESALGRFIIMGDADDSYDFSQLDFFIDELRGGADLVMGNRFRGGIAPGAMPKLHYYLGNPVLSLIGRVFFRSPIRDFHCGLRGFRRQAALCMNLQTTGMEFASEIVVKATLLKMNIVEVPTKLAPDGRSRPPHLRSWRDGWRHLRFLLMYSPRWLFLIPGLLMMLSGLAIVARLFFGPWVIGPMTLDIHTMLYAAVLTVLGWQSVLFAILTKTFAIQEGLLPADRALERWGNWFSLERGLILGGFATVVGLALGGWATWRWSAADFGPLEPQVSMRWVIVSALLIMIGVQAAAGSFFWGILHLGRRRREIKLDGNGS